LNKTGVPFDIEQAEQYCESNTFAFDELVKENINKYIKQYVPKYVCGFWNSRIEGEFYIGTDDYGMIKGIPVSKGTSLETDLISQCILENIRTYVRSESSEDSDSELNISVDIVPIDTPKKQYGIHEDYTLYLEKKSHFLAEYQKFIQEYKTWQNTFEFVNMKLVDIVNVPEHRIRLKEYIESSPYRNESVLALLDTDYQLPYLSGEDMKDMKNDPSNVFYWVTHLKDELCVQYKKEKPTFFNRFKHRNIPFNLLVSVSDMIPYWADQIDLFLIKVCVGLPPRPTTCTYFNGTNWIRCNRTMDPDLHHPVCIPTPTPLEKA
jgi:hypothetical protein